MNWNQPVSPTRPLYQYVTVIDLGIKYLGLFNGIVDVKYEYTTAKPTFQSTQEMTDTLTNLGWRLINIIESKYSNPNRGERVWRYTWERKMPVTIIHGNLI
jgi:hypothetical protein